MRSLFKIIIENYMRTLNHNDDTHSCHISSSCFVDVRGENQYICIMYEYRICRYLFISFDIDKRRFPRAVVFIK